MIPPRVYVGGSEWKRVKWQQQKYDKAELWLFWHSNESLLLLILWTQMKHDILKIDVCLQFLIISFCDSLFLFIIHIFSL